MFIQINGKLFFLKIYHPNQLTFKHKSMYSKVVSSRLSWLVAHLRIFRLENLIFDQKSSKLNSNPDYCSRLYSTLFFVILHKLCYSQCRDYAVYYSGLHSLNWHCYTIYTIVDGSTARNFMVLYFFLSYSTSYATLNVETTGCTTAASIVYIGITNKVLWSLTNWGKKPSENLTSDANVDYGGRCSTYTALPGSL